MSEKKAGQSLNIFDLIDSICEEFRNDWRKGKPPSIEEALERLPSEAQLTLFRNILPLDIRFRLASGEAPRQDDYTDRFPNFRRVVLQSFDDPSLGELSPKKSRPKLAPPPISETVSLKSARRLGDYELIQELGRGGFGIVYEGLHIKSGNRVALKTLPTGVDGQRINADRLYRFRREFRRLADINHPNLVGMQSLEVADDQWYFTMDLIEGQEFLEYVRPNNELDQHRVRSCINQLAQGVIELHRRGIIHRDLKPSNVLVSEDGCVTILDFGLAAELQRAADLTLSRSGAFAGTPRYAAPEQLFGERTSASDWYAFGTMLYEALAGEPPYRGKDQISLLRQKQEEDAPRLADRHDLPSDLCGLADDLVRRDPSERLNAEEIGRVLQLDQETVLGMTTRGQVSSDGSAGEPELDFDEFKDEETVLFGREEQLALLDSLKNDFKLNGLPHVVWITGLSGEGKSSLADAFLKPLQRGSDMLVLSGRCYDRESVPFKVIDTLIDPLVRFLRSLSSQDLKPLLPTDVGALAHLFPLLLRIEDISNRDSHQLADLDDKQLHSLAFVALSELLQRISKKRQILIFVDDLQWGDAESASVLLDQMMSANAPKLMFLGGFRSDEADNSPFLTTWQRVTRDKSFALRKTEIEVSPLSTIQAREMVSRLAGVSVEVVEENAGDLLAEANGNPYFLEQLAEGFDFTSGDFRALSLGELTALKLNRLPSDSESILSAIAVAGKSVSLGEISQVCGLEKSVHRIVAKMRSERLVRLVGFAEQQSVDTYHDKLRETLLSELDGHRIKGLHLAFASVIERHSPDSHQHQADALDANDVVGDGIFAHSRAADLAYHYVNAGEKHKAFRYSLDAGRQAIAAFAFSEALGFLNQARTYEPRDIDDTNRFSLRFLLGNAYCGIGRLEEGLEALNEATLIAPSRLERADAFSSRAEAHYRMGHYIEAAEDYRLAFRELGERVPRTSFAKLFRSLASVFSLHIIPGRMLRFLSRRDSDSLVQTTRLYVRYNDLAGHRDIYSLIDSLTRACVVAKTRDDSGEKCSSYAYYGFLLAIAGAPLLPRWIVRTSERFAGDFSSIPSLGAYHYALCGYLYSIGKLDQAEHHALEAEKQLSRVSDFRLFMALHFNRHLWSVRGNPIKIEEYANKEFEVAARSNDEIAMAYGKYGLADAYSKSGRFERAIELARESIETLEKWDGTFKSVAHLELGRAQLQASDYHAARLSLSGAVRLVSRIRFFEITVPSFPLLVEAILGASWFRDDTGPTREHMTKAIRSCFAARCSARIFPNIRPHTFRVSGRLASARGKRRRALRYFEKAIAIGGKLGINYEQARALIDLSMLETADYRDHRERGLEQLEFLGCVLPDVEVEYLGVDRQAHHARAAEARTKYADEHGIPEFDLAAWESEHGPNTHGKEEAY